MTNLLDHVKQSIHARKLLSRGQRILVAVSGGLDSMVLLHVLQTLVAKHRWKLTVAHLNHQLRGRASDGDERFVRTHFAKLGLPCVVERAAVRVQAKAQAVSIEMAARELRHEFLARTARRFKITSVALAHHADDQVELFFLRLLRGTGSAGLAGMKWLAPSPANSAVQLVRPLLDVSRVQLEQYAHKNNIRFREDASNASRDILRNRIRHELLPLLRHRFQPAVNQTVLRLMEIVAAENIVLANLTGLCLEAKRPSRFASLPVAIQRRMLQRQLQQHNITTDFEMIELLRAASDQAVTVGPQLSVSRNQTGLVKFRTHAPVAFNHNHLAITPGDTAGESVFAGVRFHWRFDAAKRVLPARSPGCESFDAKRVGSQIVLRHWRAGDRFQPIGMSSPVKLQDWFTNQKIPGAQRRALIVATTAAGEIFWVENQRIGEQFKLTARTIQRLVWRWKRG